MAISVPILTPAELVYWSQFIFVSVAARYTIPSEISANSAKSTTGAGNQIKPSLSSNWLRFKNNLTAIAIPIIRHSRTIIVLALLTLIGGFSFSKIPQRLTLTIITGLFAPTVSWLQSQEYSKSRNLELPIETLAIFAFILATAGFCSTQHLIVSNPVLTLSIQPKHFAAILLSISCVIFSGQGGNRFVRLALNRASVPPLDPTSNAAKQGRIIGIFERLLMIAIVGSGDYEVLGFLIAAKGLIRAKEFENDRTLTEYFLVGNLASILVGILLGIAVRIILGTLWPEASAVMGSSAK